MSDETFTPEAPLESQRVPLEREVVLEFEHFSSFIREYSANISLGGMFVKTDDPRLRGTVFRFEIRLSDDAPLVAGLAKVLWVREGDEGADRPSGMGVQFLKLEDEGRLLIERIVREHSKRGGRPFDLDAAAAAEAAPSQQEPAAEKAAPSDSPLAASLPPGSPASERSTVIELPPLEELLKKPESEPPKPTMETPPRGWRPGISAARPRTRPQLLFQIAVAALVVTAVVFFLVRRLSAPPVLESSELEPPQLPKVEAEALDEQPEVAQPAPRFTGVEAVDWQRRGGEAEIVVRVDGALVEGSWSESRMTDPPRHVLKLIGATRPYPTRTIDVGFGGVRQLRTGYHGRPGGDEQHVVIDLADPRVILDEIQAGESTLRLRFRRISR